ncbi:DUF1905 domain-containing protein [Nocardioides sp. Soil805]|uniref:DUF1905 domain-containing protein n=1 Tax=Nocardioides sp. Soil805 TaxID=1736416 RepID=UPI000702A769|nr:DUF1905 domain-containing protein [Nocardioides sp. Soil805]KRF35439.1 hypothetical protein ASG94_12245 [Nocardioides sp. Soil805]
MAEHTFEATVWEHSPDGPGSWHFLTVPGDVSDDIAAEAGPPRGFGSVRVVVTIGSTTWRTSLFPDSKAGSYVLPLKKAVRVAEGLPAGASCRVRLSPEQDPGQRAPA